VLTHLTVSWGKRAESVTLGPESVTLELGSVTLGCEVSPWPCARYAIMYPALLLHFPSIGPRWYSLRALGKSLVRIVSLNASHEDTKRPVSADTSVVIVGDPSEAILEGGLSEVHQQTEWQPHKAQISEHLFAMDRRQSLDGLQFYNQ